jgi:hypothetical protein
MVHIGIEECIIQKYGLRHWTKERIVDRFVYDHFLSILPGYPMQSKGDTSIDPYLSGEGAWDDLPSRIEEFKAK